MTTKDTEPQVNARVRFTKHVRYDKESWDYANRHGIAVTVGDNLIRHAVAFRTHVTVRLPVWADPEKVYVTSLDELSVPPVDEDDDEGDPDTAGIRLFRDDDGIFYWRPGALVDPGESRPMTPEEMLTARRQAKAKLNDFLENVHQAGLLLAEGRLVPDAAQETAK